MKTPVYNRYKYEELIILKTIVLYEHIAVVNLYKNVKGNMRSYETLRNKLKRLNRDGIIKLTNSNPCVAYLKEGIDYGKIISFLKNKTRCDIV